MAHYSTAKNPEQELINLLKKDTKRELEYTQLLKDYVGFLKSQIIEKKNLIMKHLNIVEEDLVETTSQSMSEERSTKVRQLPQLPTGEQINHASVVDQQNINPHNTIYTNYEQDDVQFTSSKFKQNDWVTVRNKNRKHASDVTISTWDNESLNRFNALENEELSTTDDEYNYDITVNNDATNISNKRRSIKNVIINNYPENDYTKYKHVKTNPGNST